jgi:hypothetical protein
MRPLKVTAWLSNKLSVSDDWSPSLDALLIKLLLDERGLATSNPTPDDVARNNPVVDANLPIQKGEIGGQWYWQASSPCYLYDSDSVETIYKRWDQQDRNLDWRGKRRNWSSSETNTKSWTILISERSTPRIDWYCVGDATEIQRLLTLCTGLAKKRRTQVSRWDVTEVGEDWHLWRDRHLMRPVPIELLGKSLPSQYQVRNWAWRPPTHLPENMALCALPLGNALKVEAVYGCA